MPLCGVHHHHPRTQAEVDGDVEDAGANGTVKDNDMGDEDDAASLLQWNSIWRWMGGQRRQCSWVVVRRIVLQSIFDDTKTTAPKSCGRLV
jgi:hypothetical protein